MALAAPPSLSLAATAGWTSRLHPSCFAFTPHPPVKAQSPRWRCSHCALSKRQLATGSGPAADVLSVVDDDFGFLVVSFYKFVKIDDPAAEVAKHLQFLEGRDIHGRIYISEQGINAQYSGPSSDTMNYAEWLRSDSRFSDILVQASPASNGHAFPRLRLRYKPSLVQIEGGTSHLSLLDPTMRAAPLVPSEWRRRLQDCKDLGLSNGHKNSSTSRMTVLLDVRNGYEWDVGHFKGAVRPNVDCFRSTSFGLSEQEVESSDPLVEVDKENTDILMYCTGGIRCDVYSTILRKKGFKNLYTLSGGVSNYLKSEGPSGWLGNLFVFDSRLSLPPTSFMSKACSDDMPQFDSQCSSLGKCYICFSQMIDFRHRNCANIDCNRLFLCCSSCVDKYRGCCCSGCTSAPRLRPVLLKHHRYEKWHIYRDNNANTQISSST